MSFLLGLTGSIGMGKTVTAQFFEKHGCAIWNADNCVQYLYSYDSEVVDSIAKIAPETKTNGKISKNLLREAISNRPHLLKEIELIVHPLVAQDRLNFIEHQKNDILVFEIPLLFETNSQNEMDAVACVTIDKETQRIRVLSRGKMGNKQFEKMLSKQLPTEEKTRRADYVIITDSYESVEKQVKKILRHIRGKLK